MLMLPRTVRIFVALDPIDLHYSFDRLAGLVRDRLRGDPLSGHIYVFFNRRRDHMKAIFFDRSGYTMFYKRLERGSYQNFTAQGGQARLEVDPATLAMLLEGVDLDAPRRLRYKSEPLMVSLANN